jgi:predicted Rossmann fold nucleotide-binding protein DprA/Smf involved in DNA uptake
MHDAIAAGATSPEALARRGFPVTTALAGLAELEIHGHVHRTVGGRYVVAL